MKKLVYKIMFFISLIPYVCILFYAVFSAINGIVYTFIQSQTIYGLNGFLYALFIGTLWLVIYPILPVCLTYQIAYLILRKSENKKMICISTVAVAVISILLVFGLKTANEINQKNLENNYQQKEEAVRNSVSEMMENADVIIEYNMSTIYGYGIAQTSFKHNAIFIDYGSKKIAFLTNSIGPEFLEFELSENISIQSNNVQYQVELNDPGETLTAFYYDDEAKHKTIALQLVMNDGTVYSIDKIKDKSNRDGLFLGLLIAQSENENEAKYISIIGEWEANTENASMKIVFYNRNQLYIEENGIRTEGNYQLDYDEVAMWLNQVRSKIKIDNGKMSISTITDSNNNLIEFKKK